MNWIRNLFTPKSNDKLERQMEKRKESTKPVEIITSWSNRGRDRGIVMANGKWRSPYLLSLYHGVGVRLHNPFLKPITWPKADHGRKERARLRAEEADNVKTATA